MLTLMTKILIATVASFIFGFIWYSPGVFGKKWMKLSGIKQANSKKAKKGMGGKMVASLIGTFVTTFIISIFVTALKIGSVSLAIKFGFIAWLGFIGSTVQLGDILWNEKPIGLFLLNGVFWFLNLSIITLILII